MGQLSIHSTPEPQAAQYKRAATIAVVVLGHIGVLWALSHMQPMQLKPLEQTKPVQVRFVQIVEKPKTEVPQPKTPEPPPKVPPKPKEVKIVEKPTPPKKVEKVQQVKKPEAKPQPVEVPKPETKITTTTTTVTQVTPTPAPTPTPTPAPVKPTPTPAPQVDNTPRNLGDASGIAWKRKPNIKITDSDLKTISNSTVMVRVDVDENGKIRATITQSSGSAKVDREIKRAVEAARFSPYTENGVAVPFYANQPFRLQ